MKSFIVSRILRNIQMLNNTTIDLHLFSNLFFSHKSHQKVIRLLTYLKIF